MPESKKSTSLSAEDVQRLMADGSADARVGAAEKVAGAFGSGVLSDAERAIAEDIFRTLVKDAEERVRRALSDNLKAVPHLAEDVAGALARDESDSVALPVLRHSSALPDDVLIEILSAAPPARQVAIAEWSTSAETSPPCSAASCTVAEKLVSMVSDALKDHLVTHHALPEETATDLVMHSRERATVQLAAEQGGDVSALVDQLASNGRLSPSLMLRSVCLGDLTFFETALGRLAGIPLNNARVLIHDEGALGLRSLYDKAGLPRQLFPAFDSAVRQARNAESERTDEDPETRMRRLLEHVLTEHEEIVDEYGIENVDYLLSKFNKLSAENHAA
jgi:uncharacterized protein (DUF2336 family)